MRTKRAFLFSFAVEVNDDGYLVRCPAIQGAFAEGDTIEEALFNCIDVIKMIVAYRTERGENLGFPEVELTPKTQIAVSVPLAVD